LTTQQKLFIQHRLNVTRPIQRCFTSNCVLLKTKYCSCSSA